MDRITDILGSLFFVIVTITFIYLGFSAIDSHEAVQQGIIKTVNGHGLNL